MSETTRESGASVLSRIKPQLGEQSTRICLRPDLLDAWEDAQAALTELEQTSVEGIGKRLGQGATDEKRAHDAELTAAAEKVAELEEQIGASEVRFTYRAMSRDRFTALCEQYPPRDGNVIDQMEGYDITAVNEALVRLCLIDPVFESCTTDGCAHEDCGTWEQLLSVLNPTEWAELRTTCQQVNGLTKAPKSQLASRILGQRSNDSAPPEPGE